MRYLIALLPMVSPSVVRAQVAVDSMCYYVNTPGTDAVIGVDNGGGNHCCWVYTVLRLAPKFSVIGELPFAPRFVAETSGRISIYQYVSFYDLGPDMADAPVVTLVHEFRDGRLVDVTRAHCGEILADSSHEGWSLADERAQATPAAMVVARGAITPTFEIQRTRAAVTAIALQYIVCGQRDDAARWVKGAWPAAESAAQVEKLVAAWAEMARRK